MALEAVVFRHNPIRNGWENWDFEISNESFYVTCKEGSNVKCEVSAPSVAENGTSFTESCAAHAAASTQRKRRRNKGLKNKEEMENQRMTHIAVERNRRRLMNDYLAVLRSLMPPSYAYKGDQASIVGGAINYVKELEQHLHFLEGHKQRANPTQLLSNFFTFPQYSSSSATVNEAVESLPGVADIEVTMVEGHASIKVLSKRRPKQLLKMVAGFHSICLTVLHLNVTTIDQLKTDAS